MCAVDSGALRVDTFFAALLSHAQRERKRERERKRGRVSRARARTRARCCCGAGNYIEDGFNLYGASRASRLCANLESGL